MYAISRLITEVISTSKERKREAVIKLGYRNLNKGYRRLNTLIETGECPMPLRNKLPKALNIEKELIDQAFMRTAQEKAKEAELARQKREEYERRVFKPHLWIQHEIERPTGIKFWCIVFGGIDMLKVVKLPEYINDLSWITQQRIVRARIKKHLRESKGECSVFGKVTGYVYQQTYDDSIEFSVDGKLLGKKYPKPQKPEIVVEAGNKKIKDGVLYNK